MRGFLKRALLAAAIVVGVLVPAFAQSTVPPTLHPPVINDARASNHAARLVCHRIDRLRSSFADDWYGDTRAAS